MKNLIFLVLILSPVLASAQAGPAPKAIVCETKGFGPTSPIVYQLSSPRTSGLSLIMFESKGFSAVAHLSSVNGRWALDNVILSQELQDGSRSLTESEFPGGLPNSSLKVSISRWVIENLPNGAYRNRQLQETSMACKLTY